MAITLIAAVAENGVIGKDGEIPWDIPADLQRFRELTMGNTIIMGRKTFDSLGSPLDGRNNIVISRDMNIDLVEHDLGLCRTLDDAFDMAKQYSAPIYIIGGSSIYQQVLDRGVVSELEITEVKGSFEGDAFFPKVEWDGWMEWERSEYDTHSFVSYRRTY
tara:strand:- start:4085 stop:4567 length:483 start_codon:yes stop_codon:yes gene_type:complete